MVKVFKRLGLFAILAVLSLSLAACSFGGEETGEEDSIKIGAILPLTGDGAAYGVPLQQVAQIAIDKINEEGGVDGKTLEFLWQDGKCNGQDASAAAQYLIDQEGVAIIYGGFCSSETLGAAPIAEQAGVILFSPGSSSPDVTDAGDYVFRNYPSDASQGKILAGLATDDSTVTKVGMLTEENDYTIGIDKVFTETFTANGGEVVSETFLPTDTDFKTQITKLKGEGVDAIFVNPQTPPKTDLLLKQLQEQGIGENIQLFANDVAMGSKEYLQRYPELAYGMLGAETSYDTEHPGYKHFVSKYAEMNNGEEVPFQTYAATVYDAVYLIKEGIEAVGHDADAFKGWLYGINGWEGVAGSLTIDENGDPTSGHIPKVVVGDGEVILLSELDGPIKAGAIVEEPTEEEEEEVEETADETVQ